MSGTGLKACPVGSLWDLALWDLALWDLALGCPVGSGRGIWLWDALWDLRVLALRAVLL